MKEVAGLGPHLFPDLEDSAGPMWVSAFASSAAIEMPGQMSPMSARLGDQRTVRIA